ncbi:histidine kinase dimerization/phosphoacceptor domain -containing protein [Flavobacterium aquidurense]|uniref:tetratricopeptide repeat-containing sensor histidine kinase n=1 Tax=Flavobacterium aquidurense TaxID=362413 RepID=UPI00285849D7|nr:histidine kinase dimerization/phosphoacceptor domain -containing protein [Flavobacterium aquidurense]MDR7369900.1 two-component sensor histidine kinase [Flavobacterium aquidurense]
MQHLLKTCLLFFFFHINITVFSQPLSKQKSEQIKAELKKNLNDTTRILKLQTLSLYYVTKVGEDKADMDSSYVFAREADFLSQKINYNKGKWMSLILYSQIFREGNNPSKGIRELKKAFEIAHKNNILWLEGEAYRELTNYYDINKRECIIRIKIVEKAYRAFKKGGSKQQIADILLYYGGHYFYLGNFKAALQKYNEAKNLYEAIGDKDQMQNLYSHMSETCSKIGLYTESVKYSLQSINMGEQDKNIFFLMEDYTNLALTYYKMGNYELALNYHQKSFDYNLKIYSEFFSFYNASYIIKDLIKLGRNKKAKHFFNTTVRNLKVTDARDQIWLQICYMILFDDLNNYPISNQACYNLMELQKANQKKLPEMINLEINNNIVAHLFKIKNYELAAEYLNNNIKLGKSIKDIDMIINGQFMKFKLDSAAGNYISAISHLRKYEKAKDSIFNDLKFYQISNLQIKYETEKKDKNIHVLTNQSELQKVKIKNDKIIKIVAGVILILLLIITILIFRSYKNKKESNEKLELSKLDIEKKNKVLKNVVKEKEWLLKELHHRVKNNLQVVMSLLNTQSSYLKDEYAVDAIKNSQNRIYSMSLIHQRLYQSDGLSCVKISEYIKELVNYLKDSYQSESNYILDIEDIEMHVSQAVPIGLILNEAITNALKYAFPDQKKGTIKISLRHFEDDYFALEISDNGIGIEGEIDITKYNSLGMKLMEGLSSDLNGEFKVTSSNGLKISVVFLYDYSFAIKMKS